LQTFAVTFTQKFNKKTLVIKLNYC